MSVAEQRGMKLVLTIGFLVSFASSAGAETKPDIGWRANVVVGAPAILGVGAGYKLATGTEVLANVGGILVTHFYVVTAGVTARHDIVRGTWGGVHLDASTALVKSYSNDGRDDMGHPVADSAIDRSTVWFGVGAGFRIVPTTVAGHFDLSGGPMFGVCRGDCDTRFPIGFAIEARWVIPF